MRAIAAVIVVAACAHAAPPDPIAARVEAGASLVVIDVATGEVVATAGHPNRPVPPLSIAKLYVAALWWDRVGDDVAFDGDSMEDIVARSIDRGGEQLAVELRKRVGADTVLSALREDGVDVYLPADADDARWGEALSIGERDLATTLLHEAEWLRTRARDPVASAKLIAAMRATVDHGTARGVGDRLAGTGWSLAGKTGTGLAHGKAHDGAFAGLIFAGDQPRYAIAIFAPSSGPGGGVAAALAADVAKILARTTASRSGT